MAIAAFKDLCMDATEALTLGRFWATILGGELVDLGDKSVRVDRGAPGPESIWIDPVPEPRTVKTRVHLDVRLPEADPAPLLAAGATLVRPPGGDIAWWLMADPDGNEFCAFNPREGAGPGVVELVVDAADPGAQAAWWASVTGGEAGSKEGMPYRWVTGAAGFPWAYWVFNTVPETKQVKNRVHWDVDLLGADTPDALVAAGARILREPDDAIQWWIMADPEGNEFCAFPPDKEA